MRDRTRRLVTPEGVDLRLRLAEAGGRAGAFLLDLAIILGGLIAAGLLAWLTYEALGGGERASETAGVAFVLLFFFLRSFYFTAFEMGPRAATPGKRVLGLRVAARDGRRLRPAGIIARNAMREVELFIPLGFLFYPATSGVDGWIRLAGIVWCAVFVLFPLFNRDRLRPGDLIGGTWVIEAPRKTLIGDLAAREGRAGTDGAYAFATRELDAYGIKELHVLEDVLRAKDADATAAVAERIRAKIGRTPKPGEDDARFLAAYYAGLRGRLEERMLFGVRKADKNA